MLWDSKRIRKGLVLNIVMNLIMLIPRVLERSQDSGLIMAGAVISMAVFVIFIWLWWRYYSNCVKVLIHQSDKGDEIQTLKDKIEKLEKDESKEDSLS